MALQADILNGPTGAYIKVISTLIRPYGRDPEDTRTGNYLVYEVAVYASEEDRLDDEDPWRQQLATVHVDRFKIRNYTGSDPVSDAYADLKLQTGRLSKMSDV